jgi:hypothetical protein
LWYPGYRIHIFTKIKGHILDQFTLKGLIKYFFRFLDAISQIMSLASLMLLQENIQMFRGAMRQWIQTGRELQVFTKCRTCGLERLASSQLFLSVVCYRLFQGRFFIVSEKRRF